MSKVIFCNKCQVIISEDEKEECIICDQCEMFYHLPCVNLNKTYLGRYKGNPYICDPCIHTLLASLEDKDKYLEEKYLDKEEEKDIKEFTNDLAKLIIGDEDQPAITMESLQEMLNKLCNDVIQSQKNTVIEFRKSINFYCSFSVDILEKLRLLRAVITQQVNEMNSVQTENKYLLNIANELSIRVEKLEQSTKRCTIEIHGIPLFADENILQVFMNLCIVIGVIVYEQDIDVIYRLQVKASEPPIIIVRFMRRRVAEKVMEGQKNKMNLVACYVGRDLQSGVTFQWSLNKTRVTIWNAAKYAKKNKRLRETYIDLQGRIRVQTFDDQEHIPVYSLNQLEDIIKVKP